MAEVITWQAAPPRAADDHEPCLAFAFDLGSVGAARVTRHAMIAYDEIYAIQCLGRKLRPYWRRGGDGPSRRVRGAMPCSPRCSISFARP